MGEVQRELPTTSRLYVCASVHRADNQRVAASALSSGTVLNAIKVFGATLCTVLTMVSNNKRFLGGRRTPPR